MPEPFHDEPPPTIESNPNQYSRLGIRDKHHTGAVHRKASKMPEAFRDDLQGRQR